MSPVKNINDESSSTNWIIPHSQYYAVVDCTRAIDMTLRQLHSHINLIAYSVSLQSTIKKESIS